MRRRPVRTLNKPMNNSRTRARGTTLWASRWTALGAVLTVLTGVLMVVFSPAAQADPGAWGAGHAPYSDGLVRGQGTRTTPLVSWPVGRAGTPGYLVHPIFTTGVADTGQPPRGGLVTPVTPGAYGFTTPAQIAAYAALLHTYGAAGPSATASIAELVQEISGGGNTSGSCYGTTLDRAYTAALLSTSSQRVGPLRVSTAINPAQLSLSRPATASATVTYASGAAAPGVTVTFTSSDATVDSRTVTTDPAGTATTILTATNPSLPAVHLMAAVDSFTGLSVTTAPGGVPALSLSPPEQVSATLAAPVDQSAHPVLRTTLGEMSTSVGQQVHPGVVVTGMNSHSGTATFTMVGPLPINPNTFCSSTTPDAFAVAPVASTAKVDFTGDAMVNAPAQRVSTAGCYASLVSVLTTNANPMATAVSPPSAPVTVVDTTAVLTVSNNGVAGGGAPLEAAVTVRNSHGIPARLTLSTLGPLTSTRSPGSCADTEWLTARRTTAPAPTLISGDGVYKAAGDVNPGGGTSTRGCYQLGGVLDLIVPGGASISVPVTSPNPVAAVLAPGMALKQNDTAVTSPESTTADVRVVGTYGYKAEVSLDLYYSPVNATGSCVGLDWSEATVASTSVAPTEIVADGTYRVTSGPTARIGCYAMAPRVVFADNPGAVFNLTPANQLVVILAGVGPTVLGDMVARQGTSFTPPRLDAFRASVGLYSLGGVLALAVFVVAFLRRVRPRRMRVGPDTLRA